MRHPGTTNQPLALAPARSEAVIQLVPGEAHGMVPRLLRLSKLWRDASTGSLAAQRAFSALLADVSAEYARVGSQMFTDICSSIEGSLRTLRPGAHAPASLAGAVLAGVNLMVRLSRTTLDERHEDAASVLWRLAMEMSKTLEEPLHADVLSVDGVIRRAS